MKIILFSIFLFTVPLFAKTFYYEKADKIYEKSSVFSFKIFDCKNINLFSFKLPASKKTDFIILHFSKNENSNIAANVVYNPAVNSYSNYFARKLSESAFIVDDLREISSLKFITKNADIIIDEIRIGETMADVAPTNKTDESSTVIKKKMEYVGGEKKTIEKNGDFIVSNSFLDAIIFIKGNEGAGTGFVAREGSNNYIYTNVHVLMANKKMKLINRNGKIFKPLSIETTPGRDVVRLKIKNKNIPALTIANAPENSARIAISGNSGGGDVIRTIYGKVLGTGPTKVETDAEFISGNSGSPLMLADGSVIGIATYIRKANVNWTNTNTPFAVTRRFAYRIDNIKKWKKVSPKTFIKESNILKQREKKIVDFIDIFEIWAKSPYWSKIQVVDKNIPHDMRLWIEKHNDWVDHNKMRYKGTRARPANVRNLSAELIKELGENVEILKKSFKRTTNFKRRRWGVAYFKDYAADINNFRNIMLKAIDYIAAQAASHDPVWIKRN